MLRDLFVKIQNNMQSHKERLGDRKGNKSGGLAFGTLKHMVVPSSEECPVDAEAQQHNDTLGTKKCNFAWEIVT